MKKVKFVCKHKRDGAEHVEEFDYSSALSLHISALVQMQFPFMVTYVTTEE